MRLLQTHSFINFMDRLLGIKKEQTALERLQALFEKEKIKYRIIPHPETFTAPDLAQAIHATGRRVAKVVVVQGDGKYVMAVLPSHLLLNLKRFGHLLNTKYISLAGEMELKTLFPDCEVGAAPPFGNLYGLPVYVDVSLNQESSIIFPAGNHHQVIEMRWRDFDRIVQPRIGVIASAPIQKVVGY